MRHGSVQLLLVLVLVLAGLWFMLGGTITKPLGWVSMKSCVHEDTDAQYTIICTNAASIQEKYQKLLLTGSDSPVARGYTPSDFESMQCKLYTASGDVIAGTVEWNADEVWCLVKTPTGFFDSAKQDKIVFTFAKSYSTPSPPTSTTTTTILASPTEPAPTQGLTIFERIALWLKSLFRRWFGI